MDKTRRPARAAPEGRRRYDPAAARADIQRAAREVFLREGYAGATLRRVAEAAGVPHSLLGYHFAGKHGLAEAVLDDLYGWVAPFTAAFLRGRTPDAASLAALVAGGVSALAEHPDTARSRLGADLRADDRLRLRVVERTRAPFADAVAFLRRGVEAGTVRPCDPDVAVAFAAAAVRGWFEDAAFYGEVAGRDLAAPSARAALTDLLLGLVGWLTGGGAAAAGLGQVNRPSGRKSAARTTQATERVTAQAAGRATPKRTRRAGR